MELWLPDQIAVNDTTNALIQDVEETARRVAEHRPLPPEVLRRIEDELLGERVYSSNAIEGNTLDLRETVMVLRQGIAGIAKKREATEARNLGNAVKQVTQWIDGGEPLHSRDRLLQLHRTILVDVNDDWAGRFRDRGVMIQGAKHQPPDHSLVPGLVERVLEKLDPPAGTNAILRAAWAHWALARIHPFYDGNGRIARLWQDIVLFQSQLTCAIIRPESRRNYLDALGNADEGEFNPLVQLVAERIASTFDRYLVELGRTAAFAEWVTEVAGAIDERAEETAALAYQRWQRKMEQLRREFELCAARVSEASKTVRIQLGPFPIIERTQWQNIRNGLGASKTWFFKLDVNAQGRPLRYYFFFERHYATDLDDPGDRSEHRVSLSVSEEDNTGSGVRLDEIPQCPLTIREIFVVGDAFVCRRVDPATGSASYDRDVAPLRIAQDFIREVVLKRLT